MMLLSGRTYRLHVCGHTPRLLIRYFQLARRLDTSSYGRLWGPSLLITPGATPHVASRCCCCCL